MALELVQGGANRPLGQFDGYDSDIANVLGGEVGAIVAVPIGTDNAAKDSDGTDGYVGSNRPVIRIALTSGDRPLGLIDDGTAGYGTLFGSVVGGTVGQEAYGAGSAGTNLGPHTAKASGKLTFWHEAGTYAVTLDAVDTTASTGLVATNATLAIGDALYATAAGKLTPNSSAAFEVVVLGRFLNFESYKGGSLVTTPVSLVSAANSPVGIGQPQQKNFTRALFYFNPPA